MKFTTNTKPLNDVLSMTIINSNITKFYKPSSIVKLTATTDKLIINVDYERVCMQVELLGNGDSDYATVIVDSSAFKQFMSTINSSTVTIEFKDDSGLSIISGKSRFNIPRLDITDAMKSPEIPENFMDNAVDLDKSVWKFIKNHQAYALPAPHQTTASSNNAFPVFRFIWLGESDVLTGDYENSIFTNAKLNTLSTTCLINPEILNILISVPDNTKIAQDGKSYIVYSVMDSFNYVAKFTPVYEGDEGIGSYNSDIFLGLMNREIEGVEVNASAITKYLAQSEMLNKEIIPVINFDKHGDTLTIHDRNVNCELTCRNSTDVDYNLKFNTVYLRKMLSNYGESIVTIKPIMDSENEISGIIVSDEVLTSMLATVVVK